MIIMILMTTVIIIVMVIKMVIIMVMQSRTRPGRFASTILKEHYTDSFTSRENERLTLFR